MLFRLRASIEIKYEVIRTQDSEVPSTPNNITNFK